MFNLVILSVLGNIVTFVSTIPLIRAVIKNRKAIAGFSVLGSFLTLIGLVIFDVWYLTSYFFAIPFYNWFWLLSLGISMATDLYWGLAFTFSFKKWFGERKRINKP